MREAAVGQGRRRRSGESLGSQVQCLPLQRFGAAGSFSRALPVRVVGRPSFRRPRGLGRSLAALANTPLQLAGRGFCELAALSYAGRRLVVDAVAAGVSHSLATRAAGQLSGHPLDGENRDMRRCSKCGAEHELLDPTFRRPEAYVLLSADSQAHHAKADDDLCRITLPGKPARFFVRGVLPVTVRDRPDDIWWGLWAEVPEPAFRRILELWSAPDQASEPAIEAALANVIPSYPDTLGLPLIVRLTGPTSRPELRFAPDVDHPFVRECISGVDTHRASGWSDLIDAAPRAARRPTSR